MPRNNLIIIPMIINTEESLNSCLELSNEYINISTKTLRRLELKVWRVDIVPATPGLQQPTSPSQSQPATNLERHRGQVGLIPSCSSKRGFGLTPLDIFSGVSLFASPQREVTVASPTPHTIPPRLLDYGCLPRVGFTHSLASGGGTPSPKIFLS